MQLFILIEKSQYGKIDKFDLYAYIYFLRLRTLINIEKNDVLWYTISTK